MAQGGYLVSGKDGDHLPTETEGKLDHHLMGAAWAALHGGYRGNKYEGPDKSEAIAKLKKLYEREKMDLPGHEETSSAAICAAIPEGEAPKSIMLVPAGKFEPRDDRDGWVNDDPGSRARGNARARDGSRAADRLRPRDRPGCARGAGPRRRRDG